jgi:hypothetical protein
MANTSGGGIYAAGGEYHLTTIRNCLLTNNSAGRDGGGISTNWQNELSIANCTIADNTLTGIVSYGGGLYGSYDSNTSVRDSIIWDNMGRKGSQIALGSGDPAHPLPSELKISHSNIDLRTTRTEATIDIDPDRLPVIRPGFDQLTLAANDDLSTNVVNIGFNANYFGVTSSTLYVNNNGNVTFDRPMWTFTPFGLTTNIGTAIIAPFFADVDTRSGNVVTYGTGTIDGHRAFGVNWINVGYFYMNTDKLNTFQLVLIDRSDRAPGDFDIEFNYGTINWETGDASMGQGGLGGSSARAGFSNGTGNPGTFYEIPGSGMNGAFLDSSPMGLVHDSRNSTVLGRYIFRVTLGTLDITTIGSGAPIYVENGCTVEGWDPIDPNNPLDPNGPDRPWNVNTYNIADDPNFVAGPSGDYYLSQIAAGYLQLVDSNCVDAGSDLASVLGMDEYTTRIDLVADANTVDMGYHYPLTGTEYALTVIAVGPGTVAVEPNVLDPNNAAYDPNNNVYTYRYYANSVLRLTATPEESYRVRSWSGTDNVPAWNTNSNFVTLDGDKVVRVEFEQIITHNILVPEEYATIEEAVAAAGHGDTRIIVNEGVHRVSDANGIDFQGRYITLMSTDPNDPDVVANTIIDCNGTRYTPHRAFHFHSGEDLNTIVTGFTIRNGYTAGAVGVNGGILSGPVNPTDADSPIRAASGTSVTGYGYGGAILCENASSPTITKCVITDCTVAGAWGGDGFSGIPIYAGDTDGIWGGHGGNGAGIGYGGAIACLGGSSPIISNCMIKDNIARGGGGGIGGDGSNPNDGSGTESWGGDGGNGNGDGVGGGIYCDDGSSPVITDCQFINNIATVGIWASPAPVVTPVPVRIWAIRTRVQLFLGSPALSCRLAI